MTIIHLYHTILAKMGEIRRHRLRNMSGLICGLFMARRVHLRHGARKIPGRALNTSKEKRIWRLLHNGHIRVRDGYAPIARALLMAAHRSGKVRLILDGTKVGLGYQCLMVAVAYRRRALPIAWTWVPHLCSIWRYVLRQKGNHPIRLPGHAHMYG